jgi:hypothetical protein
LGNRGRIAGLALAALLALAIGQAGTGSAQAATTTTITPASPSGTGFGAPFGYGSLSVSPWGPYMDFVYKDVPAFSLKPGDTLSFDLSHTNDADIQLQIGMAPTTTNGGDVQAAPLTQIVSNAQVPANPRGNTVTGDYELTFTAQSAFDFAGGGLLLSLGNAGGAFASDADGVGDGVQENNAQSTDPSGHFVERQVRDDDGISPWIGSAYTSGIAGFRLNIADLPAPPVTTPPATPKKKKCKKKRRRAAAAKKCKKKRR